MLCRRTSTFSCSAAALVWASGRTLKPITIALEAAARVMSDSVIAPAPLWIIFTRTPSTSILAKEPLSASTEPCTSPLMITLRSLISPSLMCLNRSSRVTRVFVFSSDWRWVVERLSAIARALRSSSNAMNGSPACGTSVRPVISTGVEGPASLILRPLSFTMARTRPKQFPATKASPTFSVPFCTRIRATGPRFLSSSASMTVPRARLSGFALYSFTSATSRIISSSSSRLMRCLADRLTKMVSPPHSSGTSS
ncbi:hypothetical protein D3C81_1338670 [compost metagenome]